MMLMARMRLQHHFFANAQMPHIRKKNTLCCSAPGELSGWRCLHAKFTNLVRLHKKAPLNLM